MRHPLHPALVHFPIACWSLATLADVASLHWGEPAWHFAGIAMLIGTLAALVAMASGLLEFVKIDDASPALADANRHMLLVMGAWLCYAASLAVRMERFSLVKPNALALGLGVLGFLVLIAAGWFGGRLVYTHGVGVRR